MKTYAGWRLGLASLAITLASFGSPRAQEPDTPPGIDGQAIAGVIERIKQDIGYYYAEENQGKKTPAVSMHADPTKCPLAHYDFRIDKLAIEVSALQTDIVKGKFGLKIPFALAGPDSIGSNASMSRTRTASQTLTIDLFPVIDPNFTLPKQLKNTAVDLTKQIDKNPPFTAAERAPPPRVTPISDTLIALRNDLTLAAASKPCLETVARKGTGASDQIKIEFEVEKDNDADVGFDIVIVSIKPESERKSKAGNTITVSFSAAGSMMVIAK
jgi:hypothetical protein